MADLENESGMHRTTDIGPPGTVTLLERQRAVEALVYQPTPTEDPNDPLNWSKWRKYRNFAMVCYYVLMTYVMLDIIGVAYDSYMELGISYNDLNNTIAGGYTGLALGCNLFIPLVYRYGRRPLYIFSSAVQFAAAIWAANATTAGGLMGFNIISGLSGAISETIVLITIADLFFVHQHATMNSIYLISLSIGAYISPVIAGYIIETMGWRWIWWWCVIFLGVNLILIIFAFDETKYVPTTTGHATPRMTVSSENDSEKQADDDKTAQMPDATRTNSVTFDTSIPMKTYRQRMAFGSTSNAPILHHYWQPFVLLFTIPGVAFTAIIYGSQLAWSSVTGSVQWYYLLYPPYNFGATAVGIFGLSPFVGIALGSIIAGPFSDRLVLWLSRRNNGVFEPEFRLWAFFPAIIFCPLAIILNGVGFSEKWAWIKLAVGAAVWGFGYILASSISLSYLTDSYSDVIGDALVAVTFVRNVLSVIFMFTLSSWIDNMGLIRTHIMMAVLCFAFLSLSIPLLIWGKKARGLTARRYKFYALRQPSHRHF